MPRGKGTQYYKPSRYTIFSGVTFVTQASGATIEKNRIQTTGVSIAASTIHSTYGYPMYQATAGVKVVSGTSALSGQGTKNLKAATFGLSTLTNILVSPSVGTEAVRLSLVKTDNTQCTVYAFTAAGATKVAPVSVNYFAVGT